MGAEIKEGEMKAGDVNEGIVKEGIVKEGDVKEGDEKGNACVVKAPEVGKAKVEVVPPPVVVCSGAV